MRRRGIKKSLPRLTAAALFLAILLVILLLLPSTWTGWLRNLAQPLLPFQRAAVSARDAVTDVLSGTGADVSFDDHDAVVRQRAVLEHTAAVLSTRVAELEHEVATLTATRSRTIEGRAVGAAGQLIPAQVLADDLLWWRSSSLIDAGSVHGTVRGAPVVSNYFYVDIGGDEGASRGLAVLRGEVLVGWIDQVGTHSSRVRLTSDVETRLKVRIGRMEEGGFQLLEDYFWLTGIGKGLMEIRDVKRSDVEQRLIREGDLILSDPFSALLPTGMTIGRVTALTVDKGNPLFAILSVESEVPLQELRRVYVYAPGG